MKDLETDDCAYFGILIYGGAFRGYCFICFLTTHVHDALQENITEDLPMPPLFQFLTVLAFKIFISEQVSHTYFNDSSSCLLLFLFLIFHAINMLQQLVIVDDYTLTSCILFFFGFFPYFSINIVAKIVFFHRLMLLLLKWALGGRMIQQMLYVSNFRTTKYVFMKFSKSSTVFFSFTSS